MQQNVSTNADHTIESIMLYEMCEQEVVVMVGYPGAGKTSIARDMFGVNEGYTIIHGDEWKTSKKMIEKAIPHIKDGKSVVFDATNPSVTKRSEYFKLAQLYKIKATCIHVTTSMDEAMKRNSSRPERSIVPKIAYFRYKKYFNAPSESEGCCVIPV